MNFSKTRRIKRGSRSSNFDYRDQSIVVSGQGPLSKGKALTEDLIDGNMRPVGQRPRNVAEINEKRIQKKKDFLVSQGVPRSAFKDTHHDLIERWVEPVRLFGKIAVDQIKNEGTTSIESAKAKIKAQQRAETQQSAKQAKNTTPTSSQPPSKQTSAPPKKQGGANGQQAPEWLPVAAVGGGVLVLMSSIYAVTKNNADNKEGST